MIPQQAAPPATAGEESRSPGPELESTGLSELLDGLGGPPPRVLLYAPGGNINNGSVHGGQGVRNGPGDERRAAGGARGTRVREGPIPETEVSAAGFGFARPAWFADALAELERGVLFLAGRPGSGRRTAALNLLRECGGDDAPLRALDGVTELDRWRPTDSTARGYLMDGLFPSSPLGPGVLGHLRSLLQEAGSRMVIVLPDDTALLRRLEQDLHVRPVGCEPPPPSQVFGARFAAVVPDRHERERLLAALTGGQLGELLAPELVPAEVAELIDALVAADGDPETLGDLRARLSYRAEREVPELVAALREDPEALAFLLTVCVYEGLDHRIVRGEAERLLRLSEGRLDALLPATDTQSGEKSGRPNPDFVFRRSLTELLRSVHAVRQPREIRAQGDYTHAVEPVVFLRYGQAEAVLRHVWREYGRLSELLVRWLRDVRRDNELTVPVGRVMGLAASWGGGRRALHHIQALADSERTTSRLIAAHALGIAAEDPVLATEVRYRMKDWSRVGGSRLRTTVAFACGAEYGLSRPDLALALLHRLVRRAVSEAGPDTPEGRGDPVLDAVRAAVHQLFRAGQERQVFHWLADLVDSDEGPAEYARVLISELLGRRRWFQGQLADRTEDGMLITRMIRGALNSEKTFGTTCRTLMKWADAARWDGTLFRAVETLFDDLGSGMRKGEFRLFVEMDREAAEGSAGLERARTALAEWRSGVRRVAV
ncbi:hypothetical protein AB0O01_29045 [Streptomyces sp. NPDC093252]|uniref:hypothetical protein n=1 Tax=Streptomyces sp. NPDC093252 TaxID=3154980 RepID=UPI003430D51B